MRESEKELLHILVTSSRHKYEGKKGMENDERDGEYWRVGRGKEVME